jgi:hypothetical protein
MSAMQTKNKKNKKIYLLPFCSQKQGKTRGVLLKAASGNENSILKHALSTVEWIRITNNNCVMKPQTVAELIEGTASVANSPFLPCIQSRQLLLRRSPASVNENPGERHR